MKQATLVTLLLVAVVGCGGGEKGGARRAGASDTLTERQRDSILAQSRIPGARGVGSAMRAADSTSARVRVTDTIGP